VKFNLCNQLVFNCRAVFFVRLPLVTLHSILRWPWKKGSGIYSMINGMISQQVWNDLFCFCCRWSLLFVWWKHAYRSVHQRCCI